MFIGLDDHLNFKSYHELLNCLNLKRYGPVFGVAVAILPNIRRKIKSSSSLSLLNENRKTKVF